MTNNLCSKCYKDLVMKQKSIVTPPAEVEKTTSFPSSSMKIEPTVISWDEVDGPCDMKVVKDQVEDLCNKLPANRCFRCRKKVGLTGFKCRCENTFCSAHRNVHHLHFDELRWLINSARKGMVGNLMLTIFFANILVMQLNIQKGS
ncbi:hypothetical protein OPV22_027642 [Ensete ventricosum]|uniref:AN1-type domain-containing protein n=1 Tax=Ensete ventricosum TaxID=4639 RepID=A0AAV8PSM5_ENSVE|nr:hypothetical protein OPV22_027642 [Ensete ventricosum]